MRYMNPRQEEEVDVLKQLLAYTLLGKPLDPAEFLTGLNHAYGVHMREDVPDDLAQRVHLAMGGAEELLHQGADVGDEVANAYLDDMLGCHFRAVRREVLREFYPAPNGFRAVREYWHAERQVTGGASL